MLVFNCLLATYFFYVMYEMIGKAAWLLVILGGVTAYVPLLLTDLLFASLFITSIWQIKRLWLHFLFLGLASLVRPSLAWFFLIEPIVLYYNGYKGKNLILGFVMAFIITAFSPIRNLINHGVWTHSVVMQYNILSDTYFGGAESKIGHFIKAAKSNMLSDHYKYVGNVFGRFKVDLIDRSASKLLWWISHSIYVINIIIWIRFGIRAIQGRINYGYVLIVAYFIGPTLFAPSGARLRLPIEWILLI
jgi:hypothetical protein